MIKIKDWNELNNNSNELFIIDTIYKSSLVIRDSTENVLLSLDIKLLDNTTIISILKLFGFDIEFIEPRIYTTEEKALAVAYRNGWVARDNDIYNTINIHKHKPTRRTDNGFWKSDDSNMVCNIPQGHFLWLTFNDEPLNLSEVK